MLRLSPRAFAWQFGLPPLELLAFEYGEGRITPGLIDGLTRALAAVPDAWRHAFPALTHALRPWPDGTMIAEWSASSVMEARPREPQPASDAASACVEDSTPAPVPLNGRTLRELRLARKLSLRALAACVGSTAETLERIEAHLAPVPHGWVARINATYGTTFGFPVIRDDRP